MPAGDLALAGKNGTVYIPGTPTLPVANVNNWTLSMDAGNYDASVLGDSWRHFIPGLRGWNGAINGYWDLVNDLTGQQLISDAFFNSASVVVVLQLAPGGGQYEGTVNITAMAITDPVDGLITMDFTFVGTGSLQRNFG